MTYCLLGRYLVYKVVSRACWSSVYRLSTSISRDCCVCDVATKSVRNKAETNIFHTKLQAAAM